MALEKVPHFYHFLAEGNIICGLKASECRDAVAELADRLAKNTAGIDAEELVKEVMLRENEGSTVIAPGIAIPHARLPKIDHILVALGTSPSGVDFKTPGMPPVKVIILIATPPHDPSIYLQILTALGKDFRDTNAPQIVSALKTPSEVLGFFSRANHKLPEYLKASDLMDPDPPTLLESDTLNTAIALLAVRNISDIPIIDHERDVRGMISLEDIFRLSLPEHLLWMNDLSPILQFQPFAELLRKDRETKIADFMRDDYVAVDEQVPAIQLAKIFLMENVRLIIVTKETKLVGAVSIHDFMTKLFWA